MCYSRPRAWATVASAKVGYPGWRGEDRLGGIKTSSRCLDWGPLCCWLMRPSTEQALRGETRRERPLNRHAGDQQYATRSEIPPSALSPRPAARASSSRHVIKDGLSSPSTTSEEAPFAVRATTCDDAPFVFRSSRPVNSPNWLLRCGYSNRPRMPRDVLWPSADSFVPPSAARAGCVISN